MTTGAKLRRCASVLTLGLAASALAVVSAPVAGLEEADVVRVVVRQYGEGPVRLNPETRVVKIRFNGRRGDRVSLFGVYDRQTGFPVDEFNRWCSSVTLRPVAGGTATRPDDLHALKLRKHGWHELVYRACKNSEKRPPRVQLMKWRVRTLELDGAPRRYERRRGHLAVYEVAAKTGEWIHLQTDRPHMYAGEVWDPSSSYPPFETDVVRYRVPADGTYTFVEQRRYAEELVKSASIRARRMVQLPPMRPDVPRTFSVTDPGQWLVTTISLPEEAFEGGGFFLRATQNGFPTGRTWMATVALEPPLHCPSWGPLGCGDGTRSSVNPDDPNGLVLHYAGTYRLIVSPHFNTTGSVELTVASCRTSECPSPFAPRPGSLHSGK